MRSISTLWFLFVLVLTAVLLLVNWDITLGTQAARVNILGQSWPIGGLFATIGIAGMAVLWLFGLGSGATGRRKIQALEKEIVLLKASAYDKDQKGGAVAPDALPPSTPMHY